MSSSSTAFKTNFACTSAIRNTFLLAARFLCKRSIVTWLQSENTDRVPPHPKWMVLKIMKLQCLVRAAVLWKSNCFINKQQHLFLRRFKNKNRSAEGHSHARTLSFLVWERFCKYTYFRCTWESQMSKNTMEWGRDIFLHLTNTWCIDTQTHLLV